MAVGTKLANPAPLGLVGFGMTTVLLSLINAGVLPASGDNVVILRGASGPAACCPSLDPGTKNRLIQVYAAD